MKLIPRARLWVRLASVAVLGFALWLLLVPRIVVYEVDDADQPTDISVKYAWGRGTTDQILMLPADLFEEDPSGDSGLVTSVRLNCGLVLTSGENEASSPGGIAACSEIETPRLIGGLGLAVLALTGLAVARRSPSSEGGEHIRGGDELFRADDLSALERPCFGEDPEDKR